MRGLVVLFAVLGMLPMLPGVLAVDQVIINSQDWKDIYTGLMYAQLTGKDAHYVAEKTQGLQLINEVIDKNKKDILLLESENPVVIGYKSLLENAGFTVEKYSTNDPYQTNLEFARKAIEEKAINSFIIIDASLGYGAVSVAPYAVLNKAFVLFLNNENSDQIASLLEKEPGEIMLYGRVDRTARDALLSLDPEMISTADEFQNNVEIVSRFLEQRPTNQIIFTSGEILEKSFFNAEFPVLLIGIDSIPEHTLEFLQESSITTAVVVGYDLFSNAKNIKDETGIKVLLKYGQGRNSELYSLDIFPLPRYDTQIDISGIRYNTLSSKLEVTYKNIGNAFTLVQALSHQIASDGTVVAEVGDEKPVQLNPGDEVTVLYDVDLSSYVDTELTVESSIVFGQTASSLTRLFTKKEIPVEISTIDDSSEISFEQVEYNKNTKKFEISIKNIGKEKVYVDVDLVDIIVAEEKVTLGAETQKIDPGETALFKVKAALEPEDFDNNQVITVRVRYGQSEGILVKAVTKEFPLAFTGNSYKPLMLLMIVVILLMMLLKRRKKKKR